MKARTINLRRSFEFKNGEKFYNKFGRLRILVITGENLEILRESGSTQDRFDSKKEMSEYIKRNLYIKIT